MSANTVRISQLIEGVEFAYKIMKPIMIWGPPALGKSAAVFKACANIGVEIIDLRASLLDPVDLRGLPMIDKVKRLTEWVIPNFFPTEGKGILFLDELTQCSPAIQSALLQLILDRKLGDYELPEGWICIAAGNRSGDGTFSQKMSKALGSRFATHLELEANFDDFSAWARSEGNMAPEVTSFLNFKKSLLYQFDPKSADNSFPSPRTWELTSDAVKSGLPAGLEAAWLSGTIGEHAAIEFMGFMRIWRDLPTLEDIVANPTGIEMPSKEKAHVKYAVCGLISSSLTVANGDALMQYITRLDPEFQVICINDAVKAGKPVHKVKGFTDWAKANGHMLS